MKRIKLSPRAFSKTGRAVNIDCEIDRQKGPDGEAIYNLTVWNKLTRPEANAYETSVFFVAMNHVKTA